MEEERSSWVRRAKFSTTIYHRLDPYRLQSFPLPSKSDLELCAKISATSVAQQSSSNQAHDSTSVEPVLGESDGIVSRYSSERQRSVSPLPKTVLSEAFKEARSERRRSSTPTPVRSAADKRGMIKRLSSLSSSNLNSSQSKPKYRKEGSWTRYFDHGSGRVSAVETLEEWTIDLSKLFLGSKFASGAHSKLYHGLYDDQHVAVKVICVPDDDENGDMASRLEKQFTAEVILLSKLHHPNVLKLVAAFRKEAVFCIVTQYLAGGSLRAYLHKHEPESLPLEKLVDLSLDIARGMEYVHSQGIIHRDLKPENLLFDEDFHIKIADLGIACEEVSCDLLADDPGTYRWMAPEMIKRKPYCRKVDVYSFGLVLWEMVAGAVPYEEMSPIQAAFAVVDKDIRPTIPIHCPPVIRSLIEQCWSVRPEKRPEFWQIVRVLEQCQSILACGGTLDNLTGSFCGDRKKHLRHWIHKLGHGSHINHPTLPSRNLK